MSTTEAQELRSDHIQAEIEPGARTFGATASSDFYTTIPISVEGKFTRVLELTKTPDFNDPLSGTLRVVDLSSPTCPPFVALSYYWGPYSDPRDTIRCAGHELAITTNCKSALQHLREKHKDNVVIWVDAISIDQENTPEKQHQIPLMGDIYIRARKTFAWLGGKDEASKKALKYIAWASTRSPLPFRPRLSPAKWHETVIFALKLLVIYIIPFAVGISFPHIPFFVDVSFARSSPPPLKGGATPSGDQIKWLMEKPWFRRPWTFQECILPFKLVLICGKEHMPWDIFLRGMLVPSDNDEELEGMRKTIDEQIVETVAHGLRERQATDPRDLAYALHGILSQLRIPELSSLDLAKSQGQVYQDLFSDLLRWNPAFIILLLDAGAGRSRSCDMLNVPTWVPNWAELPSRVCISRKLFLDTDKESLGVNITRGRAPAAQLHRGSNRLIIQSVLLDDIAFSTQGFHEVSTGELAGEPIHPESNAFKSIAQLISWLLYLKKVDAGGRGYDMGPDDLMYLVTCSGLALRDEEHGTQRSYEEWREDCIARYIWILNQVYRSMQDSAMGTRDGGPGPGQEQNEVDVAVRALSWIPDAPEYLAWLINLLAQGELKLIVTSTGAPGRVPMEVEVGDRLALVAGVPVPLVLRSRDPSRGDWYDSEYEVIRPAYVQGWMDGSAFAAEVARDTVLV
ncbi:heterokaryon incompatibility protein-domain-containing protein [Hypoxylon sp. FL1284]|nr:heterokaryon incompatibility protein-domain-containing protein [Hypoxylon sp. FL1284]